VSAPAAAREFSAHAREYDALRRRLVPGYDAFYGTVAELLARLPGGVERVLDLGAGTGLLSAEIAAAVPAARFELLDASGPMLEQARARLGGRIAAVHLADMNGPLPAGPFDAIVSALAIHHLEHDQQRHLMSRIHDALRPGGVFIDAEQVVAPWPEMTAAYEAVWERQCRRLGASDAELAATRERMRHDRCADVPEILAWLRDAGFEHSDIVYKAWRLAVVAAYRRS
jgi:tRNA (cmo5U34)-methyltransferase